MNYISWSMEVIKNRRDNNMYRGVGWLEVIDGNCQNNNGSNKCDASSFNFKYDCSSNGCHLYYDNADGYNHDDEGIPTHFYRYYYLDLVPMNGPNSNLDEVTVHVIVQWNEGTVPYEVHLTSQLVEITR